jgi:cobalt-zinc-cadmium efflux system membrane fusion protein
MKAVTIASVALLAAVVPAAGAQDEAAEGPADEIRLTTAQAKLIGIETSVAKKSPIAIELWLNGEVTPDQDRTLQILPKAGGVVSETKKTLGDEVIANDQLALIESQDIPAASAAYLVARSKAELTQRQLERHDTLWKKNVISEEAYLVSRQAATEAQAQLRAATQKLSLLGIDPQSISERNTAGMASARVPVLAPTDGTIIEKKVAIGDQVTDQTPLFRIADLKRVWVIANVFEQDIANVAVGQPATVTLRAYPGKKFEGKITWISQVLDEKTRTLAARIELDNPDKLLKPGSFARVLLRVVKKEATVNVPPTAVQRQKAGQIVFIDAGGGIFKRRDIRTRIQTSEAVEVVEGLNAGERVVTSGSFILKSELEKSSFGED